MTKKKNNPSAKLLAHALTFPGAWQDDPWGDNVVKVGKKIFAFIGDDSLTLKLTEAHEAAMSVPDAKPTSYGLGKAGWVTLPLAAGVPPFDVLCDWVEESYRAIAPKKLSAQIARRRTATVSNARRSKAV